MGHAFFTKSGLDGNAAKGAAKGVEGLFLAAASSLELELVSSRLFSSLTDKKQLQSHGKNTEKLGCRGRWIDGHWVFGAVDEVGNFRCDVVDARDTETLGWIKDNVYSGSNLVTDTWAA
ncbi:hypothetical protein HHI36_018542 [Cryptolaemus montrouzieri]|uniref:Uncharacterized protein n=1 Tax=Cryptolaemus montrouzieri TaxID=559131 RepID=A0ABD2P0X4_9CUCU